MDNAVIFSLVNFNITLAFRMIQRQSPLKIRLNRIRQYDPPFGVSISVMKICFGTLVLYMGYPLSMLSNKILIGCYLKYWFLTVFWWHYFSICHFKMCIYLSSMTSLTMISYLSIYSDILWIVPCLWSVYTLYISIWFNMSYVNTKFSYV